MKKTLMLMLLTMPFVFTSCSDDDDKNDIRLIESEYKMNFNDQVQILATSPLSISYSTESSYVASVSESGLITGGRVGETNISLSNGEDTKSVKVIVEPKYDLYPEPIDKIDFGASTSKIKEIFGTPSFENASGLIYDNYSSVFDCMFLLENGKISSIIVYVGIMQMPDNLVLFLAERYHIYDEDGFIAGFINEKEDMIVGITSSDDFSNLLVMYLPNSGSSKTSLKSKGNLDAKFISLMDEYKK